MGFKLHLPPWILRFSKLVGWGVGSHKALNKVLSYAYIRLARPVSSNSRFPFFLSVADGSQDWPRKPALPRCSGHGLSALSAFPLEFCLFIPFQKIISTFFHNNHSIHYILKLSPIYAVNQIQIQIQAWRELKL